ncbi:hypothetical protein CY34DRAFT_807988 [Suillus luteus UH-Slu-Lm8-n1]|uniref:Uncharacterized protein n=1 Tax=Suillus luteus UH-Slu-Lm8-n1 TaxID=930992 RepID=A0A0D0ADA7_9AGAM|nr:hypothetical protein CY34DRAFT_807988 [Suillus luteus UH-Slu-Lm8-n1]
MEPRIKGRQILVHDVHGVELGAPSETQLVLTANSNESILSLNFDGPNESYH